MFKFGDKVYCPEIDSGIHTLEETADLYLTVETPNNFIIVNTLGIKVNTNNKQIKSIFLANEKNKQLLEKLHNTKFEQPTREVTGSELTKHLLKQNMYVLCYVSDHSDDHAIKYKSTSLICRFSNNLFHTPSGIEYKRAVAIASIDNINPLKLDL